MGDQSGRGIEVPKLPKIVGESKCAGDLPV